MPVEKLFWPDPYLTRIDATVTTVKANAVTLDRTVAFASCGGQASDDGTIGGRPIVRARRLGLEIEYLLPEGHGLRQGQRVAVVIDWPTRQLVMRLHFAAELVLALMAQAHPEAEKVGANITRDKARLDYMWEGSIAEVFPWLERELERMVSADLPIRSAFSDEAEERRYWEIEGFARVPCAGTHPESTGEVGRIRLKRVNPGAGKERIEIYLRTD